MNLDNSSTQRRLLVSVATGVFATVLALTSAPAQAAVPTNTSFTLQYVAAGSPNGQFCLDVPAFNTANGTQLDLYSCNGGANQSFTSPGDDTLHVLGKCLEAQGGKTSQLTPVVLNDCVPASNPSLQTTQKWRMDSNGRFHLVNTSQCLDVYKTGLYQQSPITLISCTSTPVSYNTWRVA
ncbi:ricin-type beta-trefoil lectin domain protein [Nocardia sp. SYP-A9097]|uniref:ricin-type beta-trefoil lectin domain protein n=1 Tax=Nocardia sp. SYP-A9097 TaxID=2663237 RepID=UPI001891DE59|nr:ricin-type beta-trefoil lectin domain protein [Nocardia sp. SYP-A9097]